MKKKLALILLTQIVWLAKAEDTTHFNLKVDSLQNELLSLKKQQDSFLISKGYFDAILNSQNANFSNLLQLVGIFIGVILAITAFFSWQFVFKRLSTIEAAVKDIDEDRKLTQTALWEANRAQFEIANEAGKYESAAVFAVRCMKTFSKKKDEEGEMFWLIKLEQSLRCLWETRNPRALTFDNENSKTEILTDLKRLTHNSYAYGQHNLEKVKKLIDWIQTKGKGM